MSEADQWNERYRESDRLWIPDADASLKEAMATIAPTTALDLGCGEGRNALYLAREGFQVTAVDFADVALDRLRTVAANEGLTIETVCEDMYSYLAHPHRFGLVILANIHPPRPARLDLYAHLREIVTPGGHLYIIGHHVDSFGVTGPPDRDRLIDEDEIRSAFDGFTIETLTKVSDIADHGHAAPSLVALLQRPSDPTTA
ncbi:class I SAM-dependent methyltransferase [Ferrimicrobium sp.]|uniref:class I SAM-dependent methyltransferase n=1 Tax=Ferrimicrobium sp. TaxID=2926050 RepID=UPI0027E4AA1A|nr:class I SAM-dependent methyltransferase [Ferrimicrobium sp.]